MGCDIHDFAEVRVDGKWQKIGKEFSNPYYRETEKTHTDADGYEWNPPKTDHPFGVRNYDTFAVLADVRNGRGFAGVPTGSGFNIIAEPRGLPVDVTPEVAAASEDYGSDGHSHSYLTLKELEAFDWNQTTTHCGWVDAKEYQQFKEKGVPDSCCGAVSGSAIRHVSTEEMERLIVVDDAKNAYTRVEWNETYLQSTGRLHKYTIPALREVAERFKVTSDDVRMVFFFDN